MSNARKPVGNAAMIVDVDMRDTVVAIGKHWGLFFMFGLSSLLFGIALLVWPAATLVVVASFIGAYLLVSGIFQIISSFTAREVSGGLRVLVAISGLLSVLLGMFAFRSVAHSLALLALIIGTGWLVRGIAQTVTAISDSTLPARGLQLFMGLITIIAGFVVLVSPISSLKTLALIGGIWLVVLGLAEIFAAFQLRSTAAKLAR